MDLDVSTLIEDKYRIVRLLGEGGMGAVYEGENIRIHRRVAIKVLHEGVAQNTDAVARFEREAQAAGRIGSDHIVEVLDLGALPNGDRFMVMEFLEGETLSSRVCSRGRLTPREVAPIATQILEGLGAAHDAQIIHRDLKPDNIFLLKKFGAQHDFVKILDFGVSKFSALSSDSGFSMTRTGAVMGTPYYLSPEQAKGAKQVDQRADLYAIGVILYECVTGRVPFDAETFNGLIMKIAFEEPERPEVLNADVDPAFGSIIAKAMARVPEERFQTAVAMREAIERWVQSGAKVSVPPSAGLQLSSQALPAAPAMPQFSGTAGTWAAASSPGVAPPKKGLGLVLGLAGVGVLAIGGVATALVMRSANTAPPAPAAEVSAPATLEPQAPTAAAPTASAPAAEASAAPEAPATSSAEPAASQKPTAEKPSKTAAASPTAKPTAAPAATATSTAAKAGSGAATAGGRKVRTEL